MASLWDTEARNIRRRSWSTPTTTPGKRFVPSPERRDKPASSADGYEWVNRGGHLYKKRKPLSLAEEYQSAYDEARAENERRYEDILGGYERRYEDAMSALKGLGEQQRADVSQQFTELGARQRANLRARGLSGTTIAPTMEQGLASQEASAQRRLEEALTRERLGYQVGLSADTLGFMERREDAYPDYGQLERLSYMEGQGRGSGRGYGLGMGAGGGGWMGERPAKKTGVSTYFAGVGSAQAPRYPRKRRTYSTGPSSEDELRKLYATGS